MRESCFHCGEPVMTGNRYLVRAGDGQLPVCCPGCKAVAEFIRDSGLEQYYEFRTAPGLTPDRADPGVANPEWLAYDRTALLDRISTINPDGFREATLQIEGVRCAACSWLIERALGELPGIAELDVNPATARARLVWNPQGSDLSSLLGAIARLGYLPHPIQAGTVATVALRERRAALKRLAVAALGMMQVMTFAVALYAGAFQGMDPEIKEFLRLISMLVATPVVLYSGMPFFRGAWRDLVARRPGMDVPVALAIGFAYLASILNSISGRGEVYFDSATMFVFFLSLGRFVEMAARHRAGEVSDALAQLSPNTALRLEEGESEARPVGLSELEPGDLTYIRTGDAFPADGYLVSERAHVDESMLTGESRALVRKCGDSIIGGSINAGNPVRVRVTRIGAGTVLSNISRMLDRAQSTRPAMARIADTVARWFVTGVLAIAALVALWWYLHDPDQAFSVTLAVLVVTCPCALSLATPTALTAAAARLASRGLLVTKGDALEKLATIDRLVLDKTGTLTYGRVSLESLSTLGRLSEQECIEIAGALEAGSEHPIARAFGIDGISPAADISVHAGEGVDGTIEGRRYRIGAPKFVAGLGQKNTALPTSLENFAVVLGDVDGLLAGFRLADPIRPDAGSLVAALRKRGLELEIASGDHLETVQTVALASGIEEFSGRLDPAQKLERIRSLQSTGQSVAMIGDGINDAPVLAGANVSIAMGEGAALAQSNADMILVGGSLAALPAGVDLARKMMRIVRQNLSWAIVYNLLALPLAAAGLVAPWMAVIGMSASSLVVVLNSARLAGARSGVSATRESTRPVSRTVTIET
jgi:Cu2+-exporting ATPase